MLPFSRRDPTRLAASNVIQHGQPQVERLALEDLLWRFAAPQTPNVHHELLYSMSDILLLRVVSVTTAACKSD